MIKNWIKINYYKLKVINIHITFFNFIQISEDLF